jgi:hypothetical protein
MKYPRDLLTVYWYFVTFAAYVEDIKRRFPKILDLGAGCGYLNKHIDDELTKELVQVEISGFVFSFALSFERCLPTGPSRTRIC